MTNRKTANWTVELLGRAATLTVGGTPSTEVPEFWSGEVPWMASGDIHRYRICDVEGRITWKGLQRSNAKLVPAGAVAIALAGQGKTRGTVALTEIDLCTNQSVALVSTDRSKLLPEFLFQSLIPRYEELRASSSGGGRGGLTKQILERFPVAYPSLEEQRRIADLLTALDESIGQAGQAVEKLALLRAGLYAELLSRHTPTDAIGTHFALRSGTTPSRTKSSYYLNGSVPWVKTLDLDGRQICQTDEKVTAQAVDECSLAVHPPGTVLIAMYGGWEQIGRTGLLATAGCTNQAITALLPRSASEWDSYFVLKSLQAIRHRWREFAVSTRKDPNITKSDVARFLVPKPCYQDQHEWAERFRSLDDLIDTERALLEKRSLQKAALLQSLLAH